MRRDSGGLPRERLPFGPLVEWVERRWPGRDPAETMGLTNRQFSHLRRRGITFVTADEICTALGVHPVYVWPEFHRLKEEAQQ